MSQNTAKISTWDFITTSIALNKKAGYKGMHTVASGFNKAFREFFGKDVDVIKTVNDFVEEGKLVLRPAKGGVILYLPENAPLGGMSLQDVLNAASKTHVEYQAPTTTHVVEQPLITENKREKKLGTKNTPKPEQITKIPEPTTIPEIIKRGRGRPKKVVAIPEEKPNETKSIVVHKDEAGNELRCSTCNLPLVEKQDGWFKCENPKCDNHNLLNIKE